MAHSIKTHSGDAVTTDFLFDKPYIKEADVHGYVDGVEAAITFVDPTTIRFTVTPATGTDNVQIKRLTDTIDARFTFPNPTYITSSRLDGNSTQQLYLNQEQADITDLQIDATDSATQAAASAAAALVSEGLADADATATAADAIATAADRVVTTQDAIDTAADAVQTAADRVVTTQDAIATAGDAVQTAADRVVTTQDAIDTAADAVLTAADVVTTQAIETDMSGRWYLPRATETNLDDNGAASTAGDQYFNTTSGLNRTFNGSTWQNTGTGETSAAAVSASDAGAYYTGTDLEAITQEIAVSNRVLIDTIVASNQALVTFDTQFTSKYKKYVLELFNVVPVTSSVDLEVETEGSAWTAGGVIRASLTNTASFSGAAGELTIWSPATADSTLIRSDIIMFGGSTVSQINGGDTTNAMTGIRFSMSSGNINTGTFRLYGYP